MFKECFDQLALLECHILENMLFMPNGVLAMQICLSSLPVSSLVIEGAIAAKISLSFSHNANSSSMRFPVNPLKALGLEGSDNILELLENFIVEAFSE